MAGRSTRRALLAALLLMAPLAAGAQRPDPPRPHYVTLGGRKLYPVRLDLAPLRAPERAALISERIAALAADRRFDPSGVTVVEQDGVSLIKGGAVELMSVTDAEAALEGLPRRRLAERYADATRRAIVTYREERSARRLLRSAGLTVVATALLVLVLFGLRRAGRWAEDRLRSVEVAPPVPRGRAVLWVLTRSATPVLRSAMAIVGWLLRASALGVWLVSVTSLFPATRAFGEGIGVRLLAELRVVGAGIAGALPDLLIVVLVVAVAHLAVRMAHALFHAAETGAIVLPAIDRDTAAPSFRIARLLIIAVTAIAAFPYVPGSDSAAFRGVSVFLGALLTLGSTSAVANLVAGIVANYMRPFRIGDRVRIGETLGDVVEKSDLVTRVRTIKNEIVTIPNALLMTNPVTNYSKLAAERGLILHTSLTIGYDAPWRTVHSLLLEAAASVEGVLAEPPPFVLQTALNDHHITYEINAHTDQPHRMVQISSDLRQAIQDRFAAAGVEIMSPMYASIRDGNPSTVPPAPES